MLKIKIGLVVLMVALQACATQASGKWYHQVGAFTSDGYKEELKRLRVANPTVTFSVVKINGYNKIITTTECKSLRSITGCFKTPLNTAVGFY